MARSASAWPLKRDVYERIPLTWAGRHINALTDTDACAFDERAPDTPLSACMEDHP